MLDIRIIFKEIAKLKGNKLFVLCLAVKLRYLDSQISYL